MIEMVNGWADVWAGFMWQGLVEGALLLIVLLVLWLSLRRKITAQVAYCLFSLVLVKVCVPIQVPVPAWVAYASPRYSLERLTAWTTAAGKSQATVSGSAGIHDSDSMELRQHSRFFGMQATEEHSDKGAGSVKQSAAPVGFSPSLSVAAGLMLAWLSVVTGLVVHFLVVQLRMRRLMAGAAAVDPAALGLNLESLLRLAGVGRRVKIVATSAVAVPAVWGLWRPRILLPAELVGQLTANQLMFALLHELAHIRRRDLVVVLLQRLVQITFFFNPAVWIANWLIDREREYACDDAALAACSFGRRDCGQGFLRIVEFASAQPMAVAPALGLFGGLSTYKTFIRSRLMRILDTKRAVQSRLSLSSVAILLILAAILLPQVRAQQKVANEPASTEEKSPADAKAAPGAVNANVKELPWPFRSEPGNQVLSPDGTRLVFRPSSATAAPTISIIDLATNRETEIVRAERSGVWIPQWSRLGGQIVYTNVTFDRTVRKSVFSIRTVSTSGGEPRTVFERPENITAQDWSADGKWVLCNVWENGLSSLWYVPVEGGGAKKLVDFGKEDEFANGRIAPSGDKISYKRVNNRSAGIYLFLLDSQKEIPVVTERGLSRSTYNQAAWSADGRFLIYPRFVDKDWRLYAQRIQDNAPLGESVLIKRDASPENITVLNDGRLLYSTVDRAAVKLFSVAIDKENGKISGPPVVIQERFPIGNFSDVILSPDGQFMAGRAPASGNEPGLQLYVVRADGTQARHIPTGVESLRVCGWTPDGKSVIVSGNNAATNGRNGHFRVDFESGGVEMIFGPHDGGPGRLSPDGQKHVYGLTMNGLSGFNVRKVNESEPEVRLLGKDPAQTYSGSAWSPDQKQIVFISANTNDRTKRRLLIMPADGGEPRQIAATAPASGEFPKWSPDGRFISFNKAEGSDGRIVLVNTASGELMEPELSVKQVLWHVWTHDGKLVFAGADEDDRQHLWSLENYLPAD